MQLSHDETSTYTAGQHSALASPEFCKAYAARIHLPEGAQSFDQLCLAFC